MLFEKTLILKIKEKHILLSDHFHILMKKKKLVVKKAKAKQVED